MDVTFRLSPGWPIYSRARRPLFLAHSIIRYCSNLPGWNVADTGRNFLISSSIFSAWQWHHQLVIDSTSWIFNGSGLFSKSTSLLRLAYPQLIFRQYISLKRDSDIKLPRLVSRDAKFVFNNRTVASRRAVHWYRYFVPTERLFPDQKPATDYLTKKIKTTCHKSPINFQ